MAEQTEKKWHSYADYSNGVFNQGKWVPTSETMHLRDLNDRMTKFDRSVFKKNKAEKKEVKLRKANLGIVFTNFKIYDSTLESVTDLNRN